MCFSAEVSFGAAAVLIGIGSYLSFREGVNKRLLLALVPLFFGIQQFMEGLVWLGLQSVILPLWEYPAQLAYIFFACLFWPVWVPIAFLVAEITRWRRMTLFVFLIYGVGIMACNFSFFLIYWPPAFALIVRHSVQYMNPYQISEIAYALATITPFFISSLPQSWILGLLVMISFVVVAWFYQYAFVSLWCFLAALISLGLLVLLRRGSKNAEKS